MSTDDAAVEALRNLSRALAELRRLAVIRSRRFTGDVGASGTSRFSTARGVPLARLRRGGTFFFRTGSGSRSRPSNSALIRIAAAHHRVMAILTQHDGTCHHLEEFAKAIHKETARELNALRQVYKDVNKFKHTGGRLFQRSPLNTTLEALKNLITLAGRAL